MELFTIHRLPRSPVQVTGDAAKRPIMHITFLHSKSYHREHCLFMPYMQKSHLPIQSETWVPQRRGDVYTRHSLKREENKTQAKPDFPQCSYLEKKDSPMYQ